MYRALVGGLLFGARCRLLRALFACFRSVLLVCALGPALRLGVSFLGLPAVACAVTPTPTIASLFNTRYLGLVQRCWPALVGRSFLCVLCL